ncbi:hypothetical protein ASE93_07565 [Serratia sp. Leaf50]|nr:hypothetical protein ASE93_07565 [Serratia sp. Leaf50]
MAQTEVLFTADYLDYAERLSVQESVYCQFMTRLTQAFEQVTYGDMAQNAALDMVPLISAEALKRVEDSDCAGQ